MLKVGLVGLGFISHEHVPGYLDSADAEIVAVCDVDGDHARSWLAKWNLTRPRVYESLEAMLDAESLDLVDILTPHTRHCEQVLQCARARVRAISVQKPMAVGLSQCDQMIEACEQHGVLLRVFENYRFYPVYREAKRRLDDGVIGSALSIRIHTMGGIRKGASWPHFWAPGSDALDVTRCQNSPLVADDGLHKFSLACWMMEREIERMSSWIDRDTPLDAPAYIRAKFKHEPGDSPKYAQFDFTFSTKLDIPCDMWLDDFVEIVGERGVMWIHQCAAAGDRELFGGNEMSRSPLFPPIVVFVNGKVQPCLEDLSLEERNWSTSFVDCTRHFIDVLHNGGTPICTGREGKDLNRYGIAALLSAQEGCDIEMSEITSAAETTGAFKLRTNFCTL